MNEICYVWKPAGLTPFEAVKKFKEKYPEFKEETVSYAGRLDPMAEGVLILLIENENKKRKKYLDLKKEYESEIVFGISTDTFDSLGLIINYNFNKVSDDKIEKTLKTFLGKQNQLYPPFSSKAVNGKPLFWWTRKERLNEIKIPEREIEIYSIELIEFGKISLTVLVNNVVSRIEKITGDFRQDEIIKSWKSLVNKNKEKELIKIRIKVKCSSGTYIRRIADDLGKRLDASAFAYTIIRTRVGEITEKDCLEINI